MRRGSGAGKIDRVRRGSEKGGMTVRTRTHSIAPRKRISIGPSRALARVPFAGWAHHAPSCHDTPRGPRNRRALPCMGQHSLVCLPLGVGPPWLPHCVRVSPYCLTIRADPFLTGASDTEPDDLLHWYPQTYLPSRVYQYCGL